MRWILRLVAWSVALALPCWALAPLYQDYVLPTAVNIILRALYGGRVSVEVLKVEAPFDLGLFAALCLAQRGVSPRARRRALLTGIPLLVAVEIVVVVAGIAIEMLAPGAGVADGPAHHLNQHLMRTVPWVAAPLAWVVLSGGRELGRLGPAAALATPAEAWGSRSATGLRHQADLDRS